MINKTDSVKNHGLMVQFIRESIRMVKNMEKDFSFGEMIVAMKAIFVRTTFTEKENTAGRMAEFMKASGSITKCKVMEFSPGLMAESTRVST